MVDLAARSALTPAGGHAVHEGRALRMTERNLHVISIRVAGRDGVAAVETALGHALPARPNATHRIDDAWIVCREPRAWRILAEPRVHRALTARLASIPAAAALVSDLSSATCTIELQGNEARNTLAAGCPLDLHPAVFRTGDAASSRLMEIPVAILKVSDQPAFLVSCERPHATTLWDWLVDAARHS